MACTRATASTSNDRGNTSANRGLKTSTLFGGVADAEDYDRQGLFAFAWTAAPARIPWIAPIICSVPFGCGMVLVFLSCFNYLIDSYLLFSASVLAANSVLRSLFGVGWVFLQINHLGTMLIVHIQLSALCDTHVQQARCKLGMHLGGLFGSRLCSTTIVSERSFELNRA